MFRLRKSKDRKRNQSCYRTKQFVNSAKAKFDQIQQKILKKHDSVKCQRIITLPSGSSYRLCSVLNHFGSSSDSGHYTVTLYNKQNNSFILLDDQSVTEHVNVSEEMYKLSYIACYTKI